MRHRGLPCRTERVSDASFRALRTQHVVLQRMAEALRLVQSGHALPLLRSRRVAGRRLPSAPAIRSGAGAAASLRAALHHLRALRRGAALHPQARGGREPFDRAKLTGRPRAGGDQAAGRARALEALCRPDRRRAARPGRHARRRRGRRARAARAAVARRGRLRALRLRVPASSPTSPSSSASWSGSMRSPAAAARAPVRGRSGGRFRPTPRSLFFVTPGAGSKGRRGRLVGSTEGNSESR